MRFEFIHVEKANYPVTVLCSVMRVSRSGYYSWRNRVPSGRERQREERALKVRTVHRCSRETYGSPRVHRRLRQLGEVISQKTVAKIMRENGIAARHKRRFKVTTDSRKTKRIAPNLLGRRFSTEKKNEAWVTDVTAIWTDSGWCYLAAMIDLYSRRIVGWEVSASNDTKLALAALNNAITSRKPPPGLLHHSDRGSPYGSDAYIKALDDRGIRRSMSRKGDCWDNAVAESFFASLEHECRRKNKFKNTIHARRVVSEYIDDFYNPQRLHSTNNFESPINFELHSESKRLAA